MLLAVIVALILAQGAAGNELATLPSMYLEGKPTLARAAISVFVLEPVACRLSC
jgi:hypothetical protein